MRKKISMKEDVFFSATKKRLVIWLLSLFIFYLFSYFISPFDVYWKSFFTRSWLLVAEDVLWTFLHCIVICEISLAIDRMLNKKMIWTKKPMKRLVIQGFLQILASTGIVIFINSVFLNSFYPSTAANQVVEFTWLSQWIATSITVGLIISAINTGNFLLNNWKNTSIMAAEHKVQALKSKQAAMAAEMQALKMQIDPHFVFNNLSVLSELILEDQQIGYQYAENFAKVYRYLLINSKKDLISLDEELKFLQSYIFLTQKRIGDGVTFNISIDEKYRNFSVPPLTLQLLVENAIKHNQTTKANPLMIKIFSSENKELWVSNTFLPLINKPESSGLGINNIFTRYELLGNLQPQINQAEGWYTVKIPLL